MANSLTHAALPYPIKHARFSLRLPFRTSAGVPTDPTTPDTEFSIDGGASYSDCGEEITTGGGNGTGYLTLTGAETNHDSLDIAAKSANCLTSHAFLSPRVLPILESGTAQSGAAGSITLASGAFAHDLSGCIVRTTGGTGGGGTGGANNQARIITAYNTSTKLATVEPNWETTPDATTTYDVLITETSQSAAASGADSASSALAYSTRAVIRGTVGLASTTSAIVTSALGVAGSNAAQFNGRVLIFDTSTATAALQGQGAVISSSTVSATPTIALATALSTAASSGDTFTIY